MAVRNGVMTRGTSNSNSRGSVYQRRARKAWLLSVFDPDLGPDLARCAFGCGTFVTFETISVDRYPIMGADGGTYARDNIRPSCVGCNEKHGAAEGGLRSAARRAG